MLFTPKYTFIVYEELYQQKADLMRESGFRVRGAIASGGLNLNIRDDRGWYF